MLIGPPVGWTAILMPGKSFRSNVAIPDSQTDGRSTLSVCNDETLKLQNCQSAASSHCAATVPGSCGDANQHSHANRPSIRICQSRERFPSAPATGSNDARMLVVFGADGLGGSPQDTVADALGPVSGVRGFCDLIELLADLPDVEDDVQLFIVALDVQAKFVARFL
jgi:hypothetical protein